MTSDRKHHEVVQKIFSRACELTGSERDAYLDQACGDDPTLRQEVEELLALDVGSVEPASVSVQSGTGQADDSTRELLGRIQEHTPPKPRYKLEGEIARGGMGTILRVWDEDLRRHLAMKVVLGRGEAKSTRHAGFTSTVKNRRSSQASPSAPAIRTYPWCVPISRPRISNPIRAA